MRFWLFVSTCCRYIAIILGDHEVLIGVVLIALVANGGL
jgi:hypothetical protein